MEFLATCLLLFKVPIPKHSSAHALKVHFINKNIREPAADIRNFIPIPRIRNFHYRDAHAKNCRSSFPAEFESSLTPSPAEIA
jgi:hypothetical protein